MATLLNQPTLSGEQPTAIAEPTGDRRRRGAVLLVGAIVVILAVKPVGPLDYVWVPILTGLTFLLAAVAAGRRSPLWGPGLVVTAWGIGQWISSNAHDTVSSFHWSGAFVYVLLGGAALLAAWMSTRGFGVSPFSIGAAIVFIGVGVLVHSNWGSALTPVFCALTAVWGLWEIFRPERSEALIAGRTA